MSDKPCPNCGHCHMCGRGNVPYAQPWPYRQPWQPYPYQPYPYPYTVRWQNKTWHTGWGTTPNEIKTVSNAV